jgi:hypothetical protein
MIAFLSGAAFGAVCALLIISSLLFFIWRKRTAYGEEHAKYLLLGVLGAISFVLIVGEFITTALANELPFYAGWLPSYVVIVVTLLARYRIWKPF